MPNYDVYVNADRRDLGGVASDVGVIVAKYQKHLPKGTRIVVLGQATTMKHVVSWVWAAGLSSLSCSSTCC